MKLPSSVKDSKSELKYGFYGRLNSEFPSQIIVDITEVCNLECIHCPHTEFKKSEYYGGRFLFMKVKSLIDEGEFILSSFTTKQKESFEALKEHDLAADWMVAPQQGGILWEVCSHLAYLQLHFLPDISEPEARRLWLHAEISCNPMQWSYPDQWSHENQ